jgi:hypothetical protein
MEAQEFAQEFQESQESVQCCEVDDFRIYLEGTPASPWNKSAGLVFVQSFLDSHENFPDGWDIRTAVFTAYTTRLKSLIRDYRKLQKPIPDQKKMRAEHNKYERKSTVSISLMNCTFY